ncbi:MAG TPA: peptide ABC transporter permease [Microvirga sp.]|jgi:hypothetical protein|nr:peptide ABC transporter permease [Microvirga sp.]
MARIPLPATTDPAADAAALLRRLGFAILTLGVPVMALFARRAVVVMAPLGIVLLVIASALDGGARPLKESLGRLTVTPTGVAAALVVLWCALSLVWTPFPAEASERLFNIVGTVLLAVGGYLALPERMRSANLYVLPVGVSVAALSATALALFARSDEATQNLERGLVVLAILLWPAMGWLRSRGRHMESLLLALAAALATMLGPSALPLQGLAAGAIVFGLAAASPRLGATLTAGLMAGLLVVAPLLPFILRPLVALVLGDGSGAAATLDAWRDVVLNEPVRLITGHGFETALRSRYVGFLPQATPSTLLFEIWYELGIVGAWAAAVALGVSARRAGRDHPLLVPGILAAYATAFAYACLGIGTAQVWFLTTLAATVLIFVAAERGQFRTTRPKAMLRRRF